MAIKCIEEVFKGRFGEKADELVNGLTKFLSSKNIEPDSLLTMKSRELVDLLEPFFKEKGLNLSPLEIIDIFREASDLRFREAATRAAIPAIMARSGGEVKSDIVERVREKLKQ
ncbi:MAG: hypothetical protein QXS91_02215 [Candidatus Anstonellales archaeon]